MSSTSWFSDYTRVKTGGKNMKHKSLIESSKESLCVPWRSLLAIWAEARHQGGGGPKVYYWHIKMTKLAPQPHLPYMTDLSKRQSP